MSARPTTLRQLFGPRPEAHGDPAGRDLRAIETVIVVAIGIVLAVAVVYDVVRQVHFNQRASIDRATWRAYTHVQTKHIGVRFPRSGSTDFACRSTSTIVAVAHRQTRLCLMVDGPTVDGVRHVSGGYWIRPAEPDHRRYRYGCFGEPAQRSLCASAQPGPRDIQANA